MLSSFRLGGMVRSQYLHQAPSMTRLMSAAAASVPKSDLAKLRKKTGYSLSICKKALGETGNDVSLAEKWLVDQAQAQGWAKASKLQGRNTSQGLMGVRVQDNVAAMVELNCETDFVARNKTFLALLEDVSTACIKTEGVEGLTVLEGPTVGALTVEEGKSLADLVALNIGQMGENLALGRVTVVRAGEGARLAGLCHPSTGGEGEVLSGRYATVLTYTAAKPDPVREGQSAAEVARGVCQHIIGMNPTAISNEEDKENSLLHQSYLLDEEFKVGEVLEQADMKLLDFVRTEVGRSAE